MKTLRFRLQAIFLLVFAVCVVHARAQGEPLAIVGADVVPMDSERIARNQVVIVADGEIQSVSDTAATTLPADMRQIDAAGLYLIPGLADLHVHLRNEDELVNYLAWGVTTIMHLGGTGQSGAQLLDYRREIQAGERPGPAIFATDRILDGVPAIATGAHGIDSADEARRVVRELADGGYDFVKIYNNVSQSVFDAIVDEARRQGLPVIGHIPRNFDPVSALGGGQNVVAHTEELFFTYFEGPREVDDVRPDWSPDPGKLPELIEVLSENDVALMPDLVFSFSNLLMWDSLDHLWGNPEFPYLHPSTAAGWQAGNINRRPSVGRFMLREQQKYNLLQTLTLAFERAGVLQVIGTDASLPGLYPGKAAHRELTELVKAGLSNYEALAVGTRNAGEFIRRYLEAEARVGQVRPGYRADLVLVEDNPLADVRNTRLVRAVVAAGKYYDHSALGELRNRLRVRYDALRQLDDRVVQALGDENAAAALEELVTGQPDDPEALAMIESRVNTAGYAAGFAGDLERARALLEINTRLFPDSANTWDSLAEITLYLGDRKGAIELYRRALRADPGLVNARDQLESLQRDTEPNRR